MDRVSNKRSYSDSFGFPFSRANKRTSSYNNSATMSAYTTPLGRASRSSYGSSSGYRSRYRRSSGPYRNLTYGSRHTNPVYPRPECKFVDVAAISNLSVSSTGAINAVPLNQLAQGTDGSTRIGMSVSTKSLAYHIDFRLGATPVPCTCRVFFVWDKQPNAGPVAITDVLAGSPPTFVSFLNIANKDRFTILRNDIISLSPQGDQTAYIEKYVKINMQSQYTNAGVIPTTGAVWVGYISDQATAANQPVITIQGRVRFYDN